MNAQADMDQCTDCGAWLPAEDPRPEGTPRTPCPKCGSTRRIKSVAAHIKAGAELSADVTLIIGWQEVDRLLEKNEYAAALLVAAVNVEFVLEECLAGLPAPPKERHLCSLRSIHGMLSSPAGSGVSLASLFRLADWYVREQKLSFSPVLDSVEPLKALRTRIVHERGDFAKITQLKDPEWTETCIRQVLAGARAFCHANG